MGGDHHCIWPELRTWAVGRSQAHQTHTLQVTGPADVEELLVTGGAGSRTEDEACGLRRPLKRAETVQAERQSLENRVWSGLGAARAILVDAV